MLNFAKSLVSTNSTIPAQVRYCTADMETGHRQFTMIPAGLLHSNLYFLEAKTGIAKRGFLSLLNF